MAEPFGPKPSNPPALDLRFACRSERFRNLRRRTMSERPRVLIVEDEAHIRRFVRIALERAGMTIHEATTVESALSDSACRSPELIIVDLGLPDGDGKSFIKELRTWSEVPVVV